MRAVQQAITQFGVPQIFNTDQGCQFTSVEFTTPLLEHGVQLSMDGRGRALDNVFIERLWRTVKYEEIYLHGYGNLLDARVQLARYFQFYHYARPHSSLHDRTPAEAYHQPLPAAANL